MQTQVYAALHLQGAIATKWDNSLSPLEPGKPQAPNRPAKPAPSQEPAVLYNRSAHASLISTSPTDTSAIKLVASIAMEPTKQGVPADPSSSQQQPHLPPAAPPPPAPPPQQSDVQPPQPSMSLLPPPTPQGLAAPTAAHGELWQPQQFVRMRPSFPMLQPQQFVGLGMWPSFPMPQPQQFVGMRPYLPTAVGQTSAGGPQAGAIDSSSAWGSFDTHASALLSADQVESRSRSPAPAIPHNLTLQEKQALELVSQLAPGDVGFVGSSPCLVRLLREGRELVRRTVFNGVIGALPFVMESGAWRVVFAELLRSGSFDELKTIVNVACGRGRPLIHVADDPRGLGMASLEDLFRAVEPHTELRQYLINFLLNEEGLFHLKKAPNLLRIIFTTFPYEDSSIVIQHGLDTINDVFSSEFGSKSMVECFTTARSGEHQRFEELIVSRTVEFARGRYSNYFLQEVLQRGSDQLQEGITGRVVTENLVLLSMDQHGTHVVRACFLRRASRRLARLQRVLTAFEHLPEWQLSQLVQDRYASNVVSDLLRAGRAHFSDATMALARRIPELPGVVGVDKRNRTVMVRVVMEAVRKVLS